MIGCRSMVIGLREFRSTGRVRAARHRPACRCYFVQCTRPESRRQEMAASIRVPQCSEVRAALHTQKQTLQDCATSLRPHALAW